MKFGWTFSVNLTIAGKVTNKLDFSSVNLDLAISAHRKKSRILT